MKSHEHSNTEPLLTSPTEPSPGEPEAHEPDFLDRGHLKSDLRRRTIRSGAVAMCSQALKFVLMCGRTIVLARLLTPNDYGLVAMVTAVSGFIAMFKDLGLNMATIIKEKLTHAQVSNLFWMNLALSVMLMLITAGLAPILVWFYEEPRLLWITLALTPTFLFAGLTVQHQALLRRQMRFVSIAVITNSSMVVAIVTAIVMASMGLGYWALVAMSLATPLVTAVLVWMVCPWRPAMPSRGSNVMDLVRFGGTLTASYVVSHGARMLEGMLLGWRWGAGPLGLYSKARSMVMLPIEQANIPIASVAMPSLSQVTDDDDRYRRAYTAMTEKLALLLMPMMVFLMGTSDVLVPWLLGEQWRGAAPSFAVLAIAGFLAPVMRPAEWLFVTQDQVRALLVWSVINLIMTSAAIVALLPWGGLGVAWAIVGARALQVPVVFWMAGRGGRVGLGLMLRTVCWPATASAIALVALVVLMRQIRGWQPAAAVVLGLVATAATVLAVLALSRRGRDILRDSRSVLGTVLGRRRAQ